MGLSIEREKVISEFEDFVKSFSKRDDTYYKGLFVSVLALLKEQEEEIENLKQTAQSMMEGVCLLKEQEARKKNRLPYSPDSNVQWT